MNVYVIYYTKVTFYVYYKLFKKMFNIHFIIIIISSSSSSSIL